MVGSGNPGKVEDDRNAGRILGFLATVNNATVAEIAKALDSDYKTLRPIVDSLKAEGSVKQEFEGICLVYSLPRK